MGGMRASEPRATTTASRAVKRRIPPSRRTTSTARAPASRPCPRTSSTPRSSSHGTWPASSQWDVIVSRQARAAGTSSAPVMAAAAPGTRRVAASMSPGRNKVLEGMQPQNEHSPPTSRPSTTAVDSPPTAHRPATLSPAGPAPTTTTSKSSAIDHPPVTRACAAPTRAAKAARSPLSRPRSNAALQRRSVRPSASCRRGTRP